MAGEHWLQAGESDFRLESLITGWRIVATGWRVCFQAGESDDRLESLAAGSKVSFEAE